MNVVVKASFWFILVNVVDKAVSVLTQPFINRILSQEEVGAFGVYSSWHSVFSILATFYLFCGVLEVYITNERQNKNNIVGSLNILSLIICLTVFSIVFLFLNPISLLLSLKPIYIIIMFITIFGDAMIQFWAVPKRFDYSYKIFTFVFIVLFVSKSLLSVLLSYYLDSDRVLGRLIGLCIPTIICGLTLFIFTLSKTKFKGITKYWWPAIKFNLPLIPHYLSTVILASSDRIMIEKIESLTEAGLYSVAYSFSSLCLIVFSAINSAYTPYCMSALKNKNYEGIAKSTHIIIFLSVLFSLLMIYLAPEGILIIAGDNYLDVINIVPVLIVGIYFSSFYFIFSNVEFIHEKTKLILPITLVGAALNIGLNFWLIPIFGYSAAAYTTLACYLFVALAHYFVSRYILKKDVFKIKTIVFFMVAFIALSFLALLLYKLHFVFRICAVVLIAIILIVFVIKKKDFFLELGKKKATIENEEESSEVEINEQ